VFEIEDRNLDNEIDKFLELNARRWGPRLKSMGLFFKEQASLKKDNLWLCFMTVKDVCLYGCWIYIFRDTAYFFITAFNVDFKKFMPGFILLDAIINKCCANRMKIFDCMKGQSAYKQKIGAVERKRYIIGRKK
jgi:hypothetical protein